MKVSEYTNKYGAENTLIALGKTKLAKEYKEAIEYRESCIKDKIMKFEKRPEKQQKLLKKYNKIVDLVDDYIWKNRKITIIT